MRRLSWKKIIGTAALMLLGLQAAGCGKGDGNTTTQKEYVYVPEYQSIAMQGDLDHVTLAGDTLYFIAGYYDDAAERYVQELGTLKIGEDKPELVELDVTKEASVNGININEAGNIQTIVTTYLYSEAGTEDEQAASGSEEVQAEAVEEEAAAAVLDADTEVVADEYMQPAGCRMELCEFDMDGKQVSAVNLSEGLAQEDIYIEYWETDAEGNIYVSSDQKVWVLDAGGNLLCELDTDSWIEDMFAAKDGRVFVVYYGENGVEVHPVDLQAGKLADAVETLIVADYANYKFETGRETDLLFSVDNRLYSYNFAEEAPAEVLNWLDCDIDSDNLRTFVILEDGRILAVTSEWNEDGSVVELVYLTKKKGSEVPEKKILSFGTLSLDYDIKKQIIDFNKTNQEYRIEIKEYMSEATIEDYKDAMNRMNADIIGGSCPDIIDVSSGGNMKRYASKGILEDLYPYIDSDGELKREDYLENVLHAYELDGKLYTLAPRFYINTVMGKQSDFGDRTSISLDDVIEFADSIPEDTELYEYATSVSILSLNVMMNMEHYVDWQSGECRFNSEDFIKALEFANHFQTEYAFDEDELSTPAKIKAGKLMMINTGISSVQEYQMYAAMFDEPVTFIGFPTDKESGSFISSPNVLLAMSAKSPYKEGAWQFIRRQLTKEAQEDTQELGSFGFPIMKSALEKQFAMDMEEEYYEDAEGNRQRQPKTSWGYDDFSVDIYAAKEEEVEAVRNLISSADTLYQYDEQISGIIEEEANAFFEGQKTAKETADIIQSRVQIYVNENR